MKWNIITVIEEATRHPSRSAFRKASPVAYRYALRFGMMDNLFPDTANKLEKAITLAKQYAAENGSAWGFRSKHPAESRMLMRHGYYADGSPFPKNATVAEWRANNPVYCGKHLARHHYLYGTK